MGVHALLHRIAVNIALATLLVISLLFSLPLWLSVRLRQWVFARILEFTIAVRQAAFADTRRDVLTALNGIESHDPELRSEGAIRVLEIGAGIGANFNFIRRKMKYWNIDPNEDLQSGFLEALRKNPQVEMERCVVGYGENMKEVPDNHFDVVLTTHVFCSVQCSEKVLQECRRVLVKGGRLLFMEHVALPKGTIGRFLQNLVAPLWRLIFCGCNPNRDSAEVIKNAGFSRVHLKEVYLDLPIFITRQLYGYAIA
ncbi:thiol S-methyltransferase TMT1A-like [Dermacentor andersoni]|uniref:thiol S-methyltransferase TMT1A-like n=1 Tax=Dermacentor andersoni TaxID=34620 RepID=UPI002417FCE0|nr:putative methyltransferase-like protein 7A [Dermacentor andersoni]